MTLSEKLTHITDEELIEEADQLWMRADLLSDQARKTPWWKLGRAADLTRQSWGLRERALILRGLARK